MSATAALSGGFSSPLPSPATSDTARNSGMVGIRPSTAVADAETARPTSIGGRRPRRSARRPAVTRVIALPAAKTDSAIPPHDSGRPRASTTKSGTSATRTPNTAQPLANAAARAAR